MTRAQIDVQALRDFIGTLQKFNSELENNWGALDGRWNETSSSWRDIKKDQFQSTIGWDEVRRMMRGYLSTSDQYLNFLKRLEQTATAYLDV